MDETNISFDTFSISAEELPNLTEADHGPRVLARLPRLKPEAQTKISRHDRPEDAIAGRRPQAIGPVTATAAPPTGDPTATVRFDTLPTPTGYVEPKESPRTAPEPAEEIGETAEASGWLLKLEAAVLPYERWVALAAVIAALGLTLSLLNSPTAKPPVQESPESTGFAAAEPTGPTETPFFEPATTPITAQGPRGIPSSSGPQAQLVQNVLPIQESNPTDAAGADGYPRTAAASTASDTLTGGIAR